MTNFACFVHIFYIYPPPKKNFFPPKKISFPQKF